MRRVKFYYDGECPFCKEYSKYIELRKKYDIEILNARDNLEKIIEFRAKGYDIDEGMILEVSPGKKLYHGADAAKVLDRMIEKKGVFDKFISMVVELKFFKSIVYPIVKFVRIVLLKLMGKQYRF